MNREKRAEIVRRWIFGDDATIPAEDQMITVFAVMDYAEWLADRRQFLCKLVELGQEISPKDRAFTLKLLETMSKTKTLYM